MSTERVVNPPPPRQGYTADHLRLAKMNEGFRARVYQDTTGHRTIGIGWNLDAVPMRTHWAEYIFQSQWHEAYEEMIAIDPWMLYLDPVRQAAVTDLVFNMGGVGWSRFKITRALLRDGDFEKAGLALSQSRWWGQMGQRGPRIRRMIETGLWPWE